ncbi:MULTISPECIES: hypothetical protein [Amycolatopsis]|uniref:hypothetical protein n=1 Tax=Amycolatopsis TaxID=1813 RepID=UPI001E5E2B49|nr:MULTISPECIES: hypothetical protein [Amycolatopsis]
MLQSVVLVAVAAAGPHVSMLVLAAGYVFAALIIFYLAIPTTGRGVCVQRPSERCGDAQLRSGGRDARAPAEPGA